MADGRLCVSEFLSPSDLGLFNSVVRRSSGLPVSGFEAFLRSLFSFWGDQFEACVPR